MRWDNEVLHRRGLISTGFHLPYNPKLVPIARELRKRMTEAEEKLWEGYLRDFPFRILRQRPIDQFIVDFYCPKLLLVIEIDGDMHFTSEGKSKDKERDLILKSYGLKVIHFANSKVIWHFDEVCGEILRIYLSSKRSPP